MAGILTGAVLTYNIAGHDTGWDKWQDTGKYRDGSNPMTGYPAAFIEQKRYNTNTGAIQVEWHH